MMATELVSIPTIDGLLLDGAFSRPSRITAERRAWVLLHGTGANFTSPGVLQGLAALLVDRSEAVLRLNTRGHDLMARIPTMQGSTSGGAAYEKLEEAVNDVSAACAWLGDQDFQKLSLLGHSLGAVKVILSQSKSAISEVDELVALSPPRLHHETLLKNEAFREDYLTAAELVATGRWQELVRLREPMSLFMAAEGVIQKYGPQDRFDFVAHLPRVRQRVLVIVDAKSPTTSPAFAGLPDKLAEISRGHSSVEVHSHPGDIHYRNGEVSIANLIMSWRAKRLADVDVSI
jgi:hypothetical protein